MLEKSPFTCFKPFLHDFNIYWPGGHDWCWYDAVAPPLSLQTLLIPDETVFPVHHRAHTWPGSSHIASMGHHWHDAGQSWDWSWVMRWWQICVRWLQVGELSPSVKYWNDLLDALKNYSFQCHFLKTIFFCVLIHTYLIECNGQESATETIVV